MPRKDQRLVVLITAAQMEALRSEATKTDSSLGEVVRSVIDAWIKREPGEK